MPGRSALLALTCLALACGGDATDPDPSAAVATVELSLEADTLEAGVERQLTATARDAEGNVLTGRTFTWSSEDDGIATVDNAGVVTGINNGTVTVHATVEGVGAEAQMTVYVGVTGSWAGTLLAGTDNCPIEQQLVQDLDGTIGGTGTASAPCEGSFILAGQINAGGVADSIYLYWNGSTTADVIQGGHFDGAHGIGSYLTGAGCGGQGCPVTLARTSVEVPAELVP
ncbi:MAG TPA: Ig-like domain-containing protein [Gemmatimonadales bacterium]|nr:Ig-like domain-containing protein [Gemmatimonadales bacterium]